jgi:hypothetical protein
LRCNVNGRGRIRAALLLSVLVGAPGGALADEEASKDDDGTPEPYEKPDSGWAALPIATYAPETSLGAGGFATHFFRLGEQNPEQSRPSSLTVVGIYTLRAQIIAELIPELYWDDDEGHLWSRLDFRRYPNRIWDVGPNAPDSSEERYTEHRPRWQLRAGHALFGRFFLYGHLEAIHMTVRESEAGGLLDERRIPGAEGGATVGVGPGLAWDTRDHLLVPRHGSFHELIVLTHQPFLASQYTYTTLELNLRKFIPVGDTHVLALNFVGKAQWGDVPFFDMAQLGGQDLLRGYFEGRYRDKAMVALQTEYRFPLVWRLGAVVHAAVGQVAPSIARLAPQRPKWSVGPGLRILINRDEQLNLRADAGFGPGTWGIYVTASETF